MTLDEIRTAMQCLIDTRDVERPSCYTRKARKLYDDLTMVMMKHKNTEKKKPAAETQQDLLRDKTKKYTAF